MDLFAFGFTKRNVALEASQWVGLIPKATNVPKFNGLVMASCRNAEEKASRSERKNTIKSVRHLCLRTRHEMILV